MCHHDKHLVYIDTIESDIQTDKIDFIFYFTADKMFSFAMKKSNVYNILYIFINEVIYIL